MVSIPDRKLLVSAFGGLGVVGREGMGVADRETTPFSLTSFDSEAITRSECKDPMYGQNTHFLSCPV